MKLFRLPLLVGLAVCTVMLTACGPSNTVRLLPLKPASSVLPAPTAPTISIVNFTDKRADPSSLGQRRDKSYFSTMDNATTWLGHSIADELSAKGYQVTYAGSAAEAAKGNPDYLLTGSLEELRVTEKSATSFETSMRVKYRLANHHKTLVTETLMAEQNKTSLPSSNAVEGLLKDTLRDIVGPMTDKVRNNIPR